MENSFQFVIIGGGIAGVTCAESLSLLQPTSKILLLTASPLVKAVTNIKQITKVLEDFNVEEKATHILEEECSNVTVLQETVSSLDGVNKVVKTKNGREFSFCKLCICTGGTPKVIAGNNNHVIGIRDTETVKSFTQRLSGAKRILVAGNGGIATEIVYEIENCEVVWAIKDSTIVRAFVDEGAGEFFIKKLNCKKEAQAGPIKRMKYTTEGGPNSQDTHGTALGPDWSIGLSLHGTKEESDLIHIEKQIEISRLLTPEEFDASGLKAEQITTDEDRNIHYVENKWPVYVQLTNGKVFGCDFVVSATGVSPNVDVFLEGNNFNLGDDGGLEVDCHMQTSIADVFAAGDACSAGWDHSKHWLQMRLWTQARQMGAYAAKCMSASINKEDIAMDFCFELFAHITHFFNYKVVLLGKFNAQDLGKDHELLIRITEDKEYVKVVMKDGRMQGAVLIGDTDLEETFENLILNELDLTSYGEDLLNPNIDIEDYFD